MPSALGLRRIGNIDVSQVLRASEADILHLQSRLRTWGVSNFKSYPLLLRALTHPSMSNWAERVLRAPKRSLGPNTLELLGDRVLGTCVAATVHDWLREQGEGGAPRVDSLEPWSTRFGATSIVASLVANRGLAAVAREIGLEELIRWEKPMPPVAHRGRLDDRGVDLATGIAVNREVNALAAAYEAVAAAVYLDGGYEAARAFVSTTLMERPLVVQKANAGLKEYQGMLVKEVEKWTGAPSWEVESIGLEKGVEEGAGRRVQCGVFDLEPCAEGARLASPVYYAAVVLRKGGRGVEGVKEGELLAVASHFSIEMARIAAAMQAIQMMQGGRPAVDGLDLKQEISKVPLAISMNRQERAQAMGLAFRASNGKWVGDGDYLRAGRVLGEVGVADLGGIPSQETGGGQDEMRRRVARIWEERSGQHETEGSPASGRSGREGSGRKYWLGRGLLCERTISECMEVGERVNGGLSLHQTHGHFASDTRSASDICTAVHSTVKRLNETERWWQVAELRGYNCIGSQVMRLWSVQRSMQRAGQDRSEVIGLCEGRIARSGMVEQRLIGGEGLDFAEHMPRMRKGFVGLGIVVKECGTDTALRWMSGAEFLSEQGGRDKEVESG